MLIVYCIVAVAIIAVLLLFVFRSKIFGEKELTGEEAKYNEMTVSEILDDVESRLKEMVG